MWFHQPKMSIIPYIPLTSGKNKLPEVIRCSCSDFQNRIYQKNLYLKSESRRSPEAVNMSRMNTGMADI